MIQPLVSPDLVTQHAPGPSDRSPCTLLAEVWVLLSVKRRRADVQHKHAAVSGPVQWATLQRLFPLR